MGPLHESYLQWRSISSVSVKSREPKWWPLSWYFLTLTQRYFSRPRTCQELLSDKSENPNNLSQLRNWDLDFHLVWFDQGKLLSALSVLRTCSARQRSVWITRSWLDCDVSAFHISRIRFSCLVSLPGSCSNAIQSYRYFYGTLPA